MTGITYKPKDYTTSVLMLLAAAAALTDTISNLVVILAFLVCVTFHGLKFFSDGVTQDCILKIFLTYLAVIALNVLREPGFSDVTNILLEKRILLLVPFLFYAAGIDDRQTLTFLRLFTISVALAVLISIANTMLKFGSGESFYEFSWHLSLSTIFASNYLALFAGFSILILFYSFFEQPLFPKYVSLALFCTLIAFLAVLGSRMPFFSTVIIILFYSYSRFRSKRNLRLFLLIACVGIILLVTAVPYFKSRIVVLYTVGFIADARYYEYQAAWSILKEHLLIGLGFTGAENAMVAEMERIGFHEGVHNRYNSHNQFLQSTLIAGIPGLLSTVALYWGCMVRAFQTRKFLAIAFMTYFTLCSLTECLLERNKGILFLSVFAGLLLVNNRKDFDHVQSLSRKVV